MSEIEEINLEQKAQQSKQSRHFNKPKRFIQKRKNSHQFNRKNKRVNSNQDTQDRKQNLFEIDIFNFLAKNQISDLISDIKQRCGNLAKLQIVANRIQENEGETKVILKAFFEDYESAEKCYFQYNDAFLDNLVLKTERKY